MVAIDSVSTGLRILAAHAEVAASNATSAAAAAASGHESGHGGGGAAATKNMKAIFHARAILYAEYYCEITFAFIGLLVVRNILLKASRYYARRRKTAAAARGEKEGAEMSTYRQMPAVSRCIGRIDRLVSTPVPFLPSDWTFLRVGLILINNALALVVCLTNISNGSGTAKLFADRCGRIATADLPMLYLFVGRNNILTLLTGVSYQTLRFWHIYLGAHSFIFSFVHTWAYIGQYYANNNYAKLKRAYGKLYFKMGIVAIVFMLAISVTGLAPIRRRGYQCFLALHVVGAAIILAGCWYHRPNMEPWVEATVGIWLFERLWRICSAVVSVVDFRIFVRKPVVKARASIVDGAIKLTVPCKGQAWTAGQHFYVSFWGTDFLRRPHLYGQTHPFCVANVPIRSAGSEQEMRFVLRVYKGVTADLERVIRAKIAAKGGEECELKVAVEGPFDKSEGAEDYDSLLLFAGGSGITHPSSILAEVCQKVMERKAATTNVRLIWAIHREEQAAWVSETLSEARTWADEADLNLSIDLYITRATSATTAIPTLKHSTSGTSTPTVSDAASLSEDEKKSEAAGSDDVSLAAVKARRFTGRPDVAAEISKAVAECAGRTLVVACGPVALAEDVRREVRKYSPDQVGYDIAKFDCSPCRLPHPLDPITLEGFRENSGAYDDDLLDPSRSVFGASSTYSAFGAPQDDDLDTNPFADLASSSAQLPYDPEPAQTPFYSVPEPSEQPQSTHVAEDLHVSPEQPASSYAEEPSASVYDEPAPPAFEPATPVAVASTFERSFYRETAPEPETPAPPRFQPGDPEGFSYNPYATSPPAASQLVPQSPEPKDDVPFGSRAAVRGKGDLSALLGDDKPSLGSFKRAERAEGSPGALGSKIAVLPAKSVGRKPVARPLASLLGLETEEEEPKKASAPSAKAAPAAATETALPAEVAEAPLPPETSTSAPPPPIALDTPLPPSRSDTPVQAAAPADPDGSKPSLLRATSEAPSAQSLDSVGDARYDSMVSPLDTGGDANKSEDAAWPANKPVEGLDGQLAGLRIDAAPVPASEAAESAAAPAPDYSQYIFRDDAPAPVSAPGNAAPELRTSSAETSASRGFRTFNGSDGEGGFGGADDADSLRGTYSRSVEVGDADDADTETGVSVAGTERTTGSGETLRHEREGSAPLPPLPSASPTIQGSPRSTQLGGSLGPTFVITVGDPQTVGSALNPAAQHTVYTVRTRTTSSAFRKSDFSVLRRYSHFVWLYEALMQNNPGVIVPGMPEKHALGRFGSEFVENRRLGLEAALNKIVSHPMLVGDPDLRLFLESDTFHLDIKQRKIDATAESKGFLANLSSSISGPKFVEFDDTFEQRRIQLETFETQLRSLLVSLAAAHKARHALQSSVAELQSAFLSLAQCDLSSSLRKLLDEAAAVQNKLYDLAEAQNAHEERLDGLTTVLESYARLCTSARGVFGARVKAYHSWQAAESNLRKLQSSHEKAKRSGRTHSELMNLSVAEIAENGSLRLVFGNQAERKMLDSRHDFEDVSKLTKAEMARFDKEKVEDFKRALEEYADSLAARQREVVQGWQDYHDLLVQAVETNKASTAAAANPPAPAL
ncbi:uncharacterized protein JCM10292_000783 [Rhodotorula paludigena]|uniref:uncharacterized protein n=1 Tax=Rhodotorula paludigena TaxID=86838 RepID=UPI00316F5546